MNSVICEYFKLEQIFSAVRLKIACPRGRGSSCVKVSAYCYIFRISINDTKSVEMTSITYLSKQVEKKNKQCGARESIRIVYLPVFPNQRRRYLCSTHSYF